MECTHAENKDEVINLLVDRNVIHKLELKEVINNCKVEVLECKKCGYVSLGWYRKDKTKMTYLKKNTKPGDDWTNRMSIEIDNIPKEKEIKIANAIGNLLLKNGLKFDYGGIADGATDRTCGILFEVKK